MSDTLVPAIPPQAIVSVEATHRFGQVRLAGLEREVIVVRHQAVIPSADAKFFGYVAKQVNEVAIVGVVEEHDHSGVPSRHDVANEVRRLDARSARHTRPLITNLAGPDP